jgi:hypothetical protein
LAPANYFTGNDYLEIPDSPDFTFDDSFGNVIPLSFEAWINPDDVTLFQIISKNDNSSEHEWAFEIDGGNDLRLRLFTDGSNFIGADTTDNLESYEGKMVHVVGTFNGCGPDYDVSLANGSSEVTLYVNGKAVDTTATPSGTFTGMTNGTQAVHIGRQAAWYADGFIGLVRVWNRKLSASEVDSLYNNGLVAASDYEGSPSNAYESAWQFGADGWDAPANGSVAGNIDAIGGRNDSLRFTCDTATGNLYARKTSRFTIGQRARVHCMVYVPSTNSDIDGIRISDGNGTISKVVTPTPDTWTPVTLEGVPGNVDLRIWAAEGGLWNTANDAGGDDVFYINALRVEDIGVVSEHRPENLDPATGVLYDSTGNNHDATVNGVTTTGRTLPIYENGTWTPGLTFGGGSTGMTITTQEGFWTRIGNMCHFSGRLVLSAKGSSTGAALITSLPFTTLNSNRGESSAHIFLASGMSGLASTPVGRCNTNSTDISWVDFSATQTAGLDESNFTDTTDIRFSGCYRIA